MSTSSPAATTPLSPTMTVAVDAFPVITGGENLAAQALKVIDDVIAFNDTPEVRAARQNAAVMAAYDKLTQDADNALKPGAKMDQVERDLS